MSINVCLLFMNKLTSYVTNLVSKRRFVELYCVELCSWFFYSVVILFLFLFFRSTMVSFGSGPLEKNQSGWVPNLEPLSKPIIDAISQPVVMAMEKHTYNQAKKKLKARSPSSSKTSPSSSNQ